MPLDLSITVEQNKGCQSGHTYDQKTAHRIGRNGAANFWTWTGGMRKERFLTALQKHMSCSWPQCWRNLLGV